MLKSKMILAAAALGAACAFSLPAMAGNGIVDEARIGIYDHNSNLTATRHETSDPDINVELLFKSPSWLQWMAKPRINLGANINTGNGTSIAYTGLVWDYNFNESLFIEGGFGGAIHNGETNKQTTTKLNLGCRVMFHENASLGYRLTSSSSVMLTIDHMSNAGACSPNPGLTDVGIRYGYTF